MSQSHPVTRTASSQTVCEWCWSAPATVDVRVCRACRTAIETARERTLAKELERKREREKQRQERAAYIRRRLSEAERAAAGNLGVRDIALLDDAPYLRGLIS